ncbi:MAG: S8 family serine peptidase [Chitinophagales bacterium]|nr:S8 family serine peptidase [Chitinophagales bacterium]
MVKRLRLVLIAAVLLSAVCWQTISGQSIPQDWFHLDPKLDHYYGVSDNRAYSELLKNLTRHTVIVAIIDGGTDVEHPDLKANVWTNPKEISGNGIDDDGNGYIDDIHGWNFIGGKDGDVQYDNLEITRVYRDLNARFGNSDSSKISPADKADYERYLKVKQDFTREAMTSKFNYTLYGNMAKSLQRLSAELSNDDPTADQVSSFQPENDSLAIAKNLLLSFLSHGYSLHDALREMNDGVMEVQAQVNYMYNLDFDPRYIVGDNYKDASERIYGNNDVKGPESMHGTHVAGIIGAVRGNGEGVEGIAANNVRLMIVRVVPDGDERDKDVANGIRYAVNNGAKVINMSFGKSYGYNKAAVDEAVKYAASKDVLLVHAAGNDSKDDDVNDHYPNAHYSDGTGTATNWIEVGASSYDKNVASFSNYGRRSVDLWGPGVKIYSTVTDAKYQNLQGTSMASPAVAGVAAIIRAYFPGLTAIQVREVLMKSVVKIPGKITLPGSDNKKIKLKKISQTNGVVNAYNAVKIAEKMKQ